MAKVWFLDELRQPFNAIFSKADAKMQGEFTVWILFCRVRQENNGPFPLQGCCWSKKVDQAEGHVSATHCTPGSLCMDSSSTSLGSVCELLVTGQLKASQKHRPSQASLEPSAWHSPTRRLLQNFVTCTDHVCILSNLPNPNRSRCFFLSILRITDRSY